MICNLRSTLITLPKCIGPRRRTHNNKDITVYPSAVGPSTGTDCEMQVHCIDNEVVGLWGYKVLRL